MYGSPIVHSDLNHFVFASIGDAGIEPLISAIPSREMVILLERYIVILVIESPTGDEDMQNYFWQISVEIRCDRCRWTDGIGPRTSLLNRRARVCVSIHH